MKINKHFIFAVVLLGSVFFTITPIVSYAQASGAPAGSGNSGAPAASGNSGAPASTLGGASGAPASTASGASNSSQANYLPNPIKATSIQELIYLVVNIVTYIGMILAILALIWVGFKFVAAQGNPEKLKDARMEFLYVVIGIAILIGAAAITDIIKTTLTQAGVVDNSFFTTTKK